VFGALDHLLHHQAFREVGVAVSADSVGGVESILFVAIKGEGLLAVVKAKHVGAVELGGGTDVDPALGILLSADYARTRIDVRPRLGKPAFNVIRGLFDLPEQGRKDLSPSGEQAGVRRRAVVLDGGM
jgi:hypothetical protein